MKKYNITVNGTTYEVFVEEVGTQNNPAPVFNTPVTPAPAQNKPAAPFVLPTASGEKVISPMPGTILEVKVTAGQTVKKGDVICVLEAMKMENEIPSPCDGVIGSIFVQKGSSVTASDIIATIN